MTFALGGTANVLKPPPPVVPQPLPAPDFVVDAELVPHGEHLFSGICSLCYGPAVVSGGSAPDLRASAVVLSEEEFASVVRDGNRRAAGMPRFAEYSDRDLLALRHYIRAKAAE